MELILDVKNLKKSYGRLWAVDGVSFRVARGEIVGFLGPNGAGKTTSMECLLGLRNPDEGAIQLFGVENGSDDPAIRARLGVQLQSTGLLPHLTVQEQIQLFGGFYPAALKPAQVLRLVDLEDKAKTPTRALSGGQRQRLSLALALVNQPELLILDEPTTGLDPQSRRTMWNLISDLQNQGTSILLTTHSMEEATYLCDRVAIIDQGQIIEEGAPSTLIQDHFQESALEFSMLDHLSKQELIHLAGVSQVLFENGQAILYSNNIPRTISDLFNLEAVREFELQDLTIRQATLEDVFLKLTGRRIRI